MKKIQIKKLILTALDAKVHDSTTHHILWTLTRFELKKKSHKQYIIGGTEWEQLQYMNIAGLVININII